MPLDSTSSKTRTAAKAARRPGKPTKDIASENAASAREVSKDSQTAMSEMLGKLSARVQFDFWIIGDTPLICHAWSQKAKLQMLAKQTKAVKAAKEARNPEEDFANSLYRISDGSYGFPLMAIKDSIVSVAHKDKGIEKKQVRETIRLDGQMIRAYTAHSPAICDMPVIKIYGTDPEMREDMARIGGGIQKTSALVYRAQFTRWAMRVRGSTNKNIIPLDALAYLVDEAGAACGIGDWRPEKSGIFGSFHLAKPAEAKAWDMFASGKGKAPVPYLVAA